MRAAVISAYGDVDTLQIQDLPQPTISNNEILIRVKAAAINPKDTFIRKGRFKQFTGVKMPLLTGFDFAGEVAAIGDNVREWTVGTPVFGMLDGWKGGACAEYVRVKSQQIGNKPQRLSYEEAAALPLTALTALQALRDEGHLQAGQRVCINGASGGVGSVAVQLAKIMGAHITTLSSATNLDLCRELGADDAFDYRTVDIQQHEQRFDIFFDVFGNWRFREIAPILNPSGVFVSTVVKRHVFISQFLTRWRSKKARLVVVKSNTADLEAIRRYIDEPPHLQPLIHEIYPLDNIAEAHREQQTKHARGKIIVTI